MGRKRVEVPLSSDMDDPTFLKHWNMRHRPTDTPQMRINMPYHLGMEMGYMRTFHIHCHTAERDGGLVNGERPEYDHVHEED